MRKNSWRSLHALLLTAALGMVLVMGADAAINVRQPRQRNVLPSGWKFDMNYTMWRSRRGLAATAQTWKKYSREKDRLARRGFSTSLLNTLDGALEDLSDLWESRGL